MKRKIKIFLALAVIGIVGILVYFYLPPMLSETLYPLEYKDLIIKYAKQYNLNPNYVAAVIYSESHFNSQATSPVGARGLMQIMPATGAGIAKNLGEGDKYSANKLYEPETNIRYGCYYLNTLVTKYAYSSSLPLIAYNGGVGLADRYAVNQRLVLNSETSYYVVKVKKNEQIYNQLYGEWWKEAEKPKPEPKKPTLRDLILSWLLGRG